MRSNRPLAAVRATGSLFVFLLFVSRATAGPIYQYQANIGTLPQAQGWTFFQDDPNYPPPIVRGGVLHQFQQTVPLAAQYWHQHSVPLDFAAGSYTYELDLHILSSNYVNVGTAQRAGYYMGVIDRIGRTMMVNIAGNGITINTDANQHPNNGVRFTSFNSMDGFHLYRLTIDRGVGTLYIDGSLFASTPVGGAAGVDPLILNRVFFGDASGVGRNESLLRSAYFGDGAAIVATPEPASFAVLGVAAVGLLAARRRRTA